MYVFWWSGRGYLSLIVVVLSLTAFGLLVAAGLPDAPGVWAMGLVVAAALNWLLGRRLNAKKLAALKRRPFSKQLIYPARHRFMSLPMETFSVVIALGAVAAIVWPMLA